MRVKDCICVWRSGQMKRKNVNRFCCCFASNWRKNKIIIKSNQNEKSYDWICRLYSLASTLVHFTMCSWIFYGDSLSSDSRRIYLIRVIDSILEWTKKNTHRSHLCISLAIFHWLNIATGDCQLYIGNYIFIGAIFFHHRHHHLSFNSLSILSHFYFCLGFCDRY